MYIPIHLKKPGEANNSPRIVLAGDIGGTKSNLAMFEFRDDQYEIRKELRLKTKDFNDINSMLASVLEDEDQPDAISLGVAGPVINGKVNITNLSWGMAAADISSAHGGIPAYLINDLEATSYGLALLEEKDVQILHESAVPVAGNIGLIAPGTGLGEAGLYFDGEAYHPFATEGGHSSFAPRTALDVELFYFLSKQFGHVSWERVVSGRGIENIFHFLRDEKKRQVPEFLQEAAAAGDFAKEITANAGSCQVCRETLDLFLRYLSIELSHIALKFKATSGVFIGGGIIPNIIDQVDVDVFLENFRDCGRMRSLLEDVPVKVILNERTALLGAAYYGAYQSK